MNFKTSWMKPRSDWIFGFLLLGLVVPACVKEIPDVRPIEEGITSEQISRHLGPPKASLRAEDHTVTLHYLGVPSASNFNNGVSEATIYTLGLGLPWILAEAEELSKTSGVYLLACFDRQNRLLRYDEIVGREAAFNGLNRFMQDDCIGYSRLLPEAEKGDPETQYQLGLKMTATTRREYWLRQAALQGHTGARFELGVMPQAKDRWKWLCFAAHQNHVDAQIKFADYYRQRKSPATSDSVQSYVWYKLAETNGYSGGKWNYKQISGSKTLIVTPYSEVLARKMTPEELVEAEHLFSEWQPNPDECESLTAWQVN